MPSVLRSGSFIRSFNSHFSGRLDNPFRLFFDAIPVVIAMMEDPRLECATWCIDRVKKQGNYGDLKSSLDRDAEPALKEIQDAVEQQYEATRL